MIVEHSEKLVVDTLIVVALDIAAATLAVPFSDTVAEIVAEFELIFHGALGSLEDFL